MNLISVEKISYTMHDNPLFRDTTIGMDEGDKIGFLGRNGSGKTTFLRLLKGELLPDEGTISRNSGIRIEFLSQHPPFRRECLLRDYIYDCGGVIPDLLIRYRKCFDDYQHDHKGRKKLEELTAAVDAADGWNLEKDYISLLNELGLRDPELTMGELSGGMIKKAALARVLSVKPDFLILDEPTNHLDITTIEWLEKYLKSAGFTFIMVTHDRYFLDAVCRSIIELDSGRFYKYQGNYSQYLERREERIAAQQNEQNRIQSVLKRELEWLQQGPKARTTKDRGRKQRIEELKEKQTVQADDGADFSSSSRRLGKKILEVKNICKSYDGKEVISPFTYSFKSGERIGLLGPNGSGKTTFLDLITSTIKPDSGTVDPGINTSFGYYDQMSRPLGSAGESGSEGGQGADCTVLEFIQKVSETVTLSDGAVVSAARFLEMFGFNSSYHRMDLSRLSGGEKRRLYLIRVLACSPNFLVMDEPTNDLDLETLRKLEEYIIAFKGCVIIVSHDRAFLDRTTDYLFIFDGRGGIKGYAGSYSSYRDEADEADEETGVTAAGSSKSVSKQGTIKAAGPEKPAVKTKLTFNEKREYDAIIPAVEKLEEEKAELENLFSSTVISPEELASGHERYKAVLKEIEVKTKRWEDLSEYV